MSRLFVGNFSFEQGLDPGYQPKQSILRFESELACLWRAIARDDDEILCSAAFPKSGLDRLASLGIAQPRFLTLNELGESKAKELVPWGWTPAVRQLAAQLRVPVRAPDQETVWRGNSRAWGVQTARELGVHLPGECVVHSLAELMPEIQRIHEQSGKWIIKPLHGQSGRGQIRGNGPFLSEQQFATILHLLSRQGGVTVEPQLDCIQELGGEWEILPDNTVQFHGLTLLLTDSQGRYQGTQVNSVEIDPVARENIKSVQRDAVTRLAETGYFGPVGIDAMLYRQEDRVLTRPLQDVNARWTMGRIAWEWGQHFRDADDSPPAGRWIHAAESPDPQSISLSPAELDGIPVRCRTWWVV